MSRRKKSARTDGVVEITKYENRRLYDWAQSKYITFDDVVAMVQEGKKVVVTSRTTGEDITAHVLLACLASYEEQRLIPLEDLYTYVRRIKHKDAKEEAA